MTSLLALLAISSPLSGQDYEPEVVPCEAVSQEFVTCERGSSLFMFSRTEMERVADQLRQGKRDSIARAALAQDTALLSEKNQLLTRKVEVWKGVAQAEESVREQLERTLESSEELHASELDYLINGATYWAPIAALTYILGASTN